MVVIGDEGGSDDDPDCTEAVVIAERVGRECGRGEKGRGSLG